MSDSFFDTCYGNDADFEMAELADRSTRHSKRFKGFTPEQIAQLETYGGPVQVTRWYGPKDDRRSYTVLARSVDADEVGPCVDYSIDDQHWFPTAREARLSMGSTFSL